MLYAGGNQGMPNSSHVHDIKIEKVGMVLFDMTLYVYYFNLRFKLP